MKGRETRLSFRPRPLDITKQLDLVREARELDSQDSSVSRTITHSHEALDAENEQVLMVQNKKAKGGKEIPIPEVRFVPTYNKDYFPIYKPPLTYLHGKPAQSYYGPNYVEYNLEEDDVKWLEKYKGDTGILTEDKFEMMLWKLEVACSEATDRTLQAAGASMADRMSPAACATLEHFTRDSAMDILRKAVPYRQPLLDDVYNYWYKKRQERQKPLMSRLQSPTPVSDTNPFNVFRPRERINRPQTRRRRENDMTPYEKMKAMQENLQDSLDLMEHVIRREYQKRDLLNYEVDIQQLQIQQRHEPRAKQEQIEADAAAAVKNRQMKAMQIDKEIRELSWLERVHATLIENPCGLLQVGSPEARDMLRRDYKRKRRIERRPNPNAVTILPPQPLPAQQEMLFLYPVDLSDMDNSAMGLPAGFSRSGMRARFGRGGRMCIDRWTPRFAQSYEPKPLREDVYGDGSGLDGLEPDSKRSKLGASAPPQGGNAAGQGGSPAVSSGGKGKKNPGGRPPNKRPSGSQGAVSSNGNDQQGPASRRAVDVTS